MCCIKYIAKYYKNIEMEKKAWMLRYRSINDFNKVSDVNYSYTVQTLERDGTFNKVTHLNATNSFFFHTAQECFALTIRVCINNNG